LRKRMLACRNALSPQDWISLGGLIQARVLKHPCYLAAGSVALYSAMDKEVDTCALMKYSFQQRKKVFYPKLTGNALPSFARLHSEVDLIAGRYGIPEPTGEDHWTKQAGENLLVLVPGLVFDGRGYRLGRGSGWYDRALQWLGDRAVGIGLAYDFQVVDRLPEQAWDRRVHHVITESRVICCGDTPRPEVFR